MLTDEKKAWIAGKWQYFRECSSRRRKKLLDTKALSLYRKAGFRDTGEMNNEEIVLQLDL